jgi:hypothetical protein
MEDSSSSEEGGSNTIFDETLFLLDCCLEYVEIVGRTEWLSLSVTWNWFPRELSDVVSEFKISCITLDLQVTKVKYEEGFIGKSGRKGTSSLADKKLF